MLKTVKDCSKFGGEDESRIAMSESVGRVLYCVSKGNFVNFKETDLR